MLPADLHASLEDLRGEFDLLRGERGLLAVRPGYRDAVVAAGLGPDDAGRVAAGDLCGRGPLGEVQAGEERLVVRHFQHGGVLRWMSGERYADPMRPFEELRLASELARRGIDTPLGVAAWAQRLSPFGWRLALVTRRVEGATDAEHALARLRSEPALRGRAPALFRRLGEFVGHVHRAGFLHVDLNPRNLLLEETFFQGDEARVWLLDLDRCRFPGSLTRPERLRMLGRLLRYLLRRPTSRDVLSHARLGHFLRAYEGALGETAEDWRADWRQVVRDGRRSSPLHRAGWVLEDLGRRSARP